MSETPTMSDTPTPHALMRLTKIKFHHVVPAHILAGINQGFDRPISTCPVVGMTVWFHQNGEPGGVKFRLNGNTLGSCAPGVCNLGGFGPGPWADFSAEVVEYLSHAAEQALAIVQPLVSLH